MAGSWEIDPEHRPPGRGINLDQTAMVGNDAGHQRKAKATAARLSGHERVKDIVAKLGGNTGAVVNHLDLDRHMRPPGTCPTQPSPPCIGCLLYTSDAADE